MLRVEDKRFLTGAGNYLADVCLPRETHGVFIRSPHAHAKLMDIDTSAALGVTGVLGVFTGEQMSADGIGPMRPVALVKNKDRTWQAVPRRLPLAVDKVRFVGDPIALLVAETRAVALAAAELVEVSYELLPAVVELSEATNSSAVLVWDEVADNICVDWHIGDEQAVDTAFQQASHVTSLDLESNRITAAPMETRGAIAKFDSGTDDYCLYVSSQGVHKLQQLLAKDVLAIPEANLRVITPDVGGGFGMKIFMYPEYASLLWVAKKLRRAVKWIADRNESFQCDTHARDQCNHAQLALDENGRFLGLRVQSLANLGAYLSTYGAYVPTGAGTGMLTGLYDLPAVYCEIQAVFTNTAPVDAYRGAGKPEINFVLERLIDCAAREMGLTPVELRRRNLVPRSAMPYKTALGHVFDSGDFAQNLQMVLEKFASPGVTQMSDHLRRGVGVSAYFEDTAGYQEEQARVHVNSDGQFSVYIGTQSNGQGHETTFAQILASNLKLAPERIRVRQGDSSSVSHGHGTGGSRSLIMGGEAIVQAAQKIHDKARQVAAHMFETASEDVVLTEHGFEVSGTDKRLTWEKIIARCYQPTRLPEGVEPGLEAFGFGTPKPPSYPNGIHLCEVMVDVQTGQVSIHRYVVVDDFGHVINEPIVTGQVHGGSAQGIGQALLEEALYESSTGQLLNASFMDYCLPRADDLPNFETYFNNKPCLTNVLGAKGCGEAGAIAAPSAVINAVVDALADYGVRHIAMPATPARVWSAIKQAQGGG